MKTGFTIGKFAPFHKGHEYLIETALNEVDELIVVVYDTPKLGYNIDMKTKWIKDKFPNIQDDYENQKTIYSMPIISNDGIIYCMWRQHTT